MKLTLSQIQEFTVGAISVWQDDSGYQFARFTPTQKEAFLKERPALADGAEHTTGIHLDFHTDAQSLTVKVGSKGHYEVLVDDFLTLVEELDTDESYTIPLDGLIHRITLLLPNHTVGSLGFVQLDGESFVKAHEHAMKIAFYGDSITEGWNSEKTSQSYAWLLSRYFDGNSMNWGVGGSVFLPDTIEDLGFQADAVIVALGVNDSYMKTLDQIRNSSSEYFDRIASIYDGAKLFCITPTWRSGEENPKTAATVKEVRKIITEEAQNRGMIVIDGAAMIPHRKEYFGDENVHPNDVGFALYALNLTKILNQYM